MVRISGQYLGPHKTILTHGPSGSELVTDAPTDNGGTGAHFSPTDLLAAAYASCMMTIMSLAAQKESLDIQGASFEVNKIMTKTGARKVEELQITVTLPKGLAAKDRQLLEEKARSCPVALSVAKDVRIHARFLYE